MKFCANRMVARLGHVLLLAIVAAVLRPGLGVALDSPAPFRLGSRLFHQFTPSRWHSSATKVSMLAEFSSSPAHPVTRSSLNRARWCGLPTALRDHAIRAYAAVAV